MDIILVAGDSAKARTLTLRLSHLLLMWMATLVMVVAATGFAIRHLSRASPSPPTLSMPVDIGIGSPGVASAAPVEPPPQPAADLHTMALHIAQMEAQLLRLDMLGERLAKLAGFPSRELMLGTDPAVPPLVAAGASQPTLDTLTSQFDGLVARLQQAHTGWGALDSLFSLDNLRRKLLPTMSPVETMDYSDRYGWRIDPFTHERAFHEGIDIAAEEGTPILAAAAGVVVASEFHPQYGNMIDIDHGNSLVTRYAHASKRLVHVGDIVAKGAKIGEIGSTGRATGAHLHFEVRRDGVPRNPAQFLRLRG